LRQCEKFLRNKKCAFNFCGMFKLFFHFLGIFVPKINLDKGYYTILLAKHTFVLGWWAFKPSVTIETKIVFERSEISYTPDYHNLANSNKRGYYTFNEKFFPSFESIIFNVCVSYTRNPRVVPQASQLYPKVILFC